jgi:predicted nuclease of predicted toxin-antitoxin system
LKLLLDECLPVDFRHSFAGHNAHTVEWAGLKGKKNGELLKAAEEAGYEALLTVDQGISRPQRFGKRKLSIVLLVSRNEPIGRPRFIGRGVAEALRNLQAGQIVTVSE